MKKPHHTSPARTAPSFTRKFAAVLGVTTLLYAPIGLAQNLPDMSAEQIAADVEARYNSETGRTDYIAQSFDPFEGDDNMAGSTALRSASTGKSIDGQYVHSGAFLDISTIYTSNSADSWDVRGFEEAYFLDGAPASLMSYNSETLNCDTNTHTVTYDDSYARGASYGFIAGVYRVFPRYRGHRHYRTGNRGFWRNYQYDGRGHYRSRHGDHGTRNWRWRDRDYSGRRHDRDRGRYDRYDRDRDHGDRANRDRRDRDQRDRDGRDRDGRDRDGRDRDGRDRGARDQTQTPAIRVHSNRDPATYRTPITRPQIYRELGERNRDRDRDRNSQDRSRPDPITQRTNDSRPRPVMDRSTDSRPRPMTQRSRPTTSITPPQRSPEIRAPRAAASRPSPVTRSSQPNRTVPMTRPQIQRSISQPTPRPTPPARTSSSSGKNSWTRPSPSRSNSSNSRKSPTTYKRPTVNKTFKSQNPRSNGMRRKLEFYPSGGYTRTDVYTSSRCLKEEMLTVHIPRERLQAATFEGMTLLLVDRTGSEVPVYLPPNYVNGFLQASGFNIYSPPAYRADP